MKPLHLLIIAIMTLSLAAGCSKKKNQVAADGGLGEPCEVNSECESGLVCAGAQCQAVGTVGLGGECYASRDCQEDLFCDLRGVCAPAGNGGEGDPCVTGAECQVGFTCRVFGFGGVCTLAGDTDIGGACEENLDCISGLVCSADKVCLHPSVAYPPFAGVECADPEDPFRAYFKVPRAGAPPADFFRLPFPNDARVDGGTGAVDLSDFPQPGQNFLGVDIVKLYVDALAADFTGWASQSHVGFRFSKALNFGSTVPQDGGVAPVFVDITDPANPVGLAVSFGYDPNRQRFRCERYYTVRHNSLDPLRPGHKYAVYLTTAIRSADDDVPVQDADFAAVLANNTPGDAGLTNAWNQYADFREYLALENIVPGTIAVASVFTVQDTVGRMGRLATAVEATADPVLSDLTLCGDGVVSPCDDGAQRTCGGTDADFYEVHGRYSVPIYQQGTAPYQYDGGGILEDGGGPIQVGTEDVCFALTIPKTGAGPWPLMVYAHGTGGSFKGVVGNGVARSLATGREPTAVFSFDGVVHGDRRNGVDIDPDNLMFNVLNPPAARDNNAQGAVDVLQALRLPDLAPFNVTGIGDAIDFDAANVFYFGHSQGSNVGVPAVAYTNRADAAIFSGAGAYLVRSLLTKTSPIDAKQGIQALLGEPPGSGQPDENHPVMMIWQTYFEQVDTANFGPLLFKRPETTDPRHVLMTWGTNDTFSTNPTLTVMARSAFLPLVGFVIEALGTGEVARPVTMNVAPDGDGGNLRTVGVLQYPNGDYDGHFVATRNTQAIGDWLEFIMTAIEGDPVIRQ